MKSRVLVGTGVAVALLLVGAAPWVDVPAPPVSETQDCNAVVAFGGGAAGIINQRDLEARTTGQLAERLRYQRRPQDDEALGRMEHMNKGARALRLPAYHVLAQGQRFESRFKHGCLDLAMQQTLSHERWCAGPRKGPLPMQWGHQGHALSTPESAAHLLQELWAEVAKGLHE